MTIAVEMESSISRSVERVYAELTAIDRYPEWLVESGVTRAGLLDEGPLATGSRLRIEQHIAGRAATLEGIVTALDGPSRFALRASDRDGLVLEIDARLTGDGPGCRVRWSVRLGLPLRYRLFERGLAAPVRRAVAADLERFQARLEAVADR